MQSISGNFSFNLTVIFISHEIYTSRARSAILLIIRPLRAFEAMKTKSNVMQNWSLRLQLDFARVRNGCQEHNKLFSLSLCEYLISMPSIVYPKSHRPASGFLLPNIRTAHKSCHDRKEKLSLLFCLLRHPGKARYECGSLFRRSLTSRVFGAAVISSIDKLII